jgi:hypothetical protein
MTLIRFRDGSRRSKWRLCGYSAGGTGRPEQQERLRVLWLLSGDAETCDLYTKALVATGQLDCSHRLHGVCAACVDASEPVRTA